MGSRLFGKGYSGILMLSLSLLIAFVFYPQIVLAGERLIRANPVTLTVFILGQGTVILDPPGGSYIAGRQVTVTAEPAEGWMFFAFGGDFFLSRPYLLLSQHRSGPTRHR